MNPTRLKYTALLMAALVLVVTFSVPGTMGWHLNTALLVYSVPVALYYLVVAIAEAAHDRPRAALAAVYSVALFAAFAGYALAHGRNDYVQFACLAIIGLAMWRRQTARREEVTR